MEPPTAKYHIREQQADALLAPVRATLRETETRLAHYIERLHLPDADADALRAARAALATARGEIERVYTESVARTDAGKRGAA